MYLSVNIEKSSNFYKKKNELTFQDAWKHCNHPNFKFLWFEDMIDNLPKAIQDISDFTNYKVPILLKIIHV